MILMSSENGEPLGQRAVRQVTKKGNQQAGVSGEEEAGCVCLGKWGVVSSPTLGPISRQGRYSLLIRHPSFLSH